MAALSFEGVSYRYPAATAPALDDVDVQIGAGQLVLLVGGSGSGKSTLLRAALGLVPHFHGGRAARAGDRGGPGHARPPARASSRGTSGSSSRTPRRSS